MTLTQHVANYVKFRRALGHTYVDQARILMDYATYAETCGDSFVRSITVLDWASTASSARQAQIKLRYVCYLTSVLHADDDRHEVPDRDALDRPISRRPSPHILSLMKIRKIMDAALELTLVGSITPLTFHYLHIGADRRDRIAAIRSDQSPADGPDGGWLADQECKALQAPPRPVG